MIIINATRKVKAIMTDRGEMISIKPGEHSGLMVASRNLIISAMNLGDTNEIGIVISGSYELDIAKAITGATPYLYTSLDEAKSKLLDPSIDYTSKLETAVDESKFAEERKSYESKISDLKSQIENLNDQLAKFNNDDRKVELELEVKELTNKLTLANSDITRKDSQIKELQDDVQNLNDNLNTVRSELGARNQDLSASANTINTLQERLRELESSQVDQSRLTELELYVTKKDEEITNLMSKNDQLKDNLTEASNTIESMKSMFNAACEKFGLYLDDNGDWQQELPKTE